MRVLHIIVYGDVFFKKVRYRSTADNSFAYVRSLSANRMAVTTCDNVALGINKIPGGVALSEVPLYIKYDLAPRSRSNEALPTFTDQQEQVLDTSFSTYYEKAACLLYRSYIRFIAVTNIADRRQRTRDALSSASC